MHRLPHAVFSIWLSIATTHRVEYHTMSNSKILIKFPTRNRPEKFLKTLNQYYSMVNDIDNIRVIVTCDADDVSMNNSEMISTLNTFKNLSYFFGNNETKIEAINADMVDDFDILILGSDDMIPVFDGYDSLIRNLFAEHFPDGDGVLWFDDGTQGNRLNTLCIMGKKYYDRFGYIYHPSYKSLYCDNEFTEVSKRLGKVIFIDKCIIRHEHPNNDISLTDELYLKNDSYLEEDKKTFMRRLNRNFDPRVILISFATPRFYNMQKRLSDGVKQYGISSVVNFTDQNIGDNFLEENKSMFIQDRGYGYWCWKPHIILETMKISDTGDIIIYLDSANKIISNLKYIIDKCISDDIVLFDNMDGNPRRECW